MVITCENQGTQNICLLIIGADQEEMPYNHHPQSPGAVSPHELTPGTFTCSSRTGPYLVSLRHVFGFSFIIDGEDTFRVIAKSFSLIQRLIIRAM
jgi:hypothetical protein